MSKNQSSLNATRSITLDEMTNSMCLESPSELANIQSQAAKNQRVSNLLAGAAGLEEA